MNKVMSKLLDGAFGAVGSLPGTVPSWGYDTNHSSGVLLVQADTQTMAPGSSPMLKAVEIAAVYTSLSFGIGYFGGSMERPKASILRSTKKKNRCKINQFAARIDLTDEKPL